MGKKQDLSEFVRNHVNTMTNDWTEKYVGAENPDDIWFGGLDLGSKHDYARDYMSPEQRAGWSSTAPDARRQILHDTLNAARGDEDDSFGQKLVKKGVPLALAAAGGYGLFTALGGLGAAGVGAGGGGSGALTAAGLPTGAGAGGGMGAMSGAIPAVGASPGVSGGLWSQIGGMGKKFFMNPDGTVNMGNAIKAGTIGAGALAGMVGANPEEPQPTPGVVNGTNYMGPPKVMHREQTAAPDYFTYGKQGGEHRFFTDASYDDGPATPPASGAAAPGAGAPPTTGYVPGMVQNRDALMRSMMGKAEGGTAQVRGPGSGREDKIEALLSDGEYVIDAETVALLGDGSVDEGAARLDQLRQNLRKHKGAALAKGNFSPAAKDPMSYLPGMQKGGNVQLGVKDLPPTNSRDPAPLPNAGGRYADDGMHEEALEILARAIRSKGIGSQITEREARLLDGPHVGGAPRRAKGGKLRLAAETPIRAPANERQANLDMARRMLSAYQKKDHPRPGEDVGGDPYNRDASRVKKAEGGGVDLVGAQNRLAAIQALAKSSPVPMRKAEGGQVKELDAFADRLEAALKLGSQLEIGGAMEGIQAHFAKGGVVSNEVVNSILEKYRPKTPTSPEDFQKLVEHLRSMKPDSEVLRQYDSSQKPRIYRPSEQRGVK